MTLRDALRRIAEDTDLSGGNFGNEDDEKWLECTVDALVGELTKLGFPGEYIGFTTIPEGR